MPSTGRKNAKTHPVTWIFCISRGWLGAPKRDSSLSLLFIAVHVYKIKINSSQSEQRLNGKATAKTRGLIPGFLLERRIVEWEKRNKPDAEVDFFLMGIEKRKRASHLKFHHVNPFWYIIKIIRAIEVEEFESEMNSHSMNGKDVEGQN